MGEPRHLPATRLAPGRPAKTVLPFRSESLRVRPLMVEISKSLAGSVLNAPRNLLHPEGLRLVGKPVCLLAVAEFAFDRYEISQCRLGAIECERFPQGVLCVFIFAGM